MAGRHARAILPPVNPDEGHLVGICISKAWIPVIFTALSRLEWRASWQEGTDIDRAEQCILSLYSILRNAQECGVEAMPYKLRQNPTNPCLLEQSNDNGLSWQPAFNYALCKRAPSPLDLDIWISTRGPTIISEYETIINNYTTNNDMSVFAPQIVYQTGQTEANGNRDMAICQAVRDLVAYACEAELEKRNQNALFGGLVASALSIMGALVAAGVILASAGTGTALGFALGSALTGAAAGLWSGLSREVLNNNETRDEVAHCLYCAIKGQTPDETTFSAALASCNFSFGSPAAQLAGAISGILDSLDIFATFVKYAEAAIPRAELGLINCPFECESQEVTVNFTVSSHPYHIMTHTNNTPRGIVNSYTFTGPEPGTRPALIAQPTPNNPNIFDVYIRVNVPFECRSISLYSEGAGNVFIQDNNLNQLHFSFATNGLMTIAFTPVPPNANIYVYLGQSNGSFAVDRVTFQS